MKRIPMKHLVIVPVCQWAQIHKLQNSSVQLQFIGSVLVKNSGSSGACEALSTSPVVK
jgi:hypothetical protein